MRKLIILIVLAVRIALNAARNLANLINFEDRTVFATLRNPNMLSNVSDNREINAKMKSNLIIMNVLNLLIPII